MSSLKEFMITRLLSSIPTMLVLVTTTFLIIRILPGDPAIIILGPKAPEAYVEALREQLGLNEPLHIQYISYIRGLLSGDLGVSLVSKRPVLELILERLPATLELSIISMFLAVPLGLFAGIISARKKNGKIDFLIRVISLGRWCLPAFWVGLMLQLLFSVNLGILPISGRIDSLISLDKITGLYLLDSIVTGNIVAFVSSLLHLIMPVLTMGTVMAASLSRLSRANLLKELNEEYVITAKLKGLSEDSIFRKHVLPNALIPILTYAGLQFAMMMGGVILTETVFSFKGMGTLLLSAVNYRDFPVIQGCTVVFALLVSLINLVIDILYAVIDPRVRY